MNQSEMMQFLLGSVGDMLNGDYDDPIPGIYEGFYNMRVSAAVDDLTYEYVSIPEPSSFPFLMTWCAAVGFNKSSSPAW